MNTGAEGAAHESSPPRAPHDGPGDVARCDRDVGPFVDRADELLDDADRDREVSVEEDDGIACCAPNARAHRGALAAVWQRQVPIRDAGLRER
jgi:hypothetical protein